MPKGTQRDKRPTFFRRRDLWVVAAVLLVGAAALFFSLMRRPGAVALVTVGSDPTPAMTISLQDEGLYHIEGALPVTLEVVDGAIRFVDSVCPDHDCEGFGWLRREGDWALCIPAGVRVWVEEQT